jgi:hypothetical protein
MMTSAGQPSQPGVPGSDTTRGPGPLLPSGVLRMTTMKRPLFPSLFAVLALAGCGSDDPYDQMISKMKGFKDKVCKCENRECIDKAEEEFDKWEESMRDKVGDKKPSDAQKKQLAEIKDQLEACEGKVE